MPLVNITTELPIVRGVFDGGAGGAHTPPNCRPLNLVGPSILPQGPCDGLISTIVYFTLPFWENKADRHKSRAYTDTTTTITDSQQQQQLTRFKNLLTDKHIIVY